MPRKRRYNPHRFHRLLLDAKMVILDVVGTVGFVWLILKVLIHELR